MKNTWSLSNNFYLVITTKVFETSVDLGSQGCHCHYICFILISFQHTPRPFYVWELGAGDRERGKDQTTAQLFGAAMNFLVKASQIKYIDLYEAAESTSAQIKVLILLISLLETEKEQMVLIKNTTILKKLCWFWSGGKQRI